MAWNDNLGQWQAAETLSHQIDQQDSRNAGMVCATWEKWLAVSSSNEAGQNSWQGITESMGCERDQE